MPNCDISEAAPNRVKQFTWQAAEEYTSSITRFLDCDTNEIIRFSKFPGPTRPEDRAIPCPFIFASVHRETRAIEVEGKSKE